MTVPYKQNLSLPPSLGLGLISCQKTNLLANPKFHLEKVMTPLKIRHPTILKSYASFESQQLFLQHGRTVVSLPQLTVLVKPGHDSYTTSI
jgi:hypothetical protein